MADQGTGRESGSGPDYDAQNADVLDDTTGLNPTRSSGSLSNHVSRMVRAFSSPRIIDPAFRPNSRRYLLQATLAALAMLAVLLFVDSLSQAALVAGLAASVVILFVFPTSHSATFRSLIGGHSLALVLGSAFSILLFAAPVESFLADLSAVRDLGFAVSVGLMMLVMAVTDTDHPPAAGTMLVVATRPWDLETVGILIGAVMLLALVKRLLNSYLRDLI